jgi:hypothetical protein
MGEWEQFVDKYCLGHTKGNGKPFISVDTEDYVKCKVLAAIADNIRVLTTAVQRIQTEIEMGACRTVVSEEK